MEENILLLFGAKDGNAQPDPAFFKRGNAQKKKAM